MKSSSHQKDELQSPPTSGIKNTETIFLSVLASTAELWGSIFYKKTLACQATFTFSCVPFSIPRFFSVPNIINENKHETQEESEENSIKTTHHLTKYKRGNTSPLIFDILINEQQIKNTHTQNTKATSF